MRIWRFPSFLWLGAALVAVLLAMPAVPDDAAMGKTAVELRPPSAFASIEGASERSAALFGEAGKVLLHPRCINCHPVGASPLQGENGARHEPVVVRGKDGFGVVGMRCTTCHLEQNYDPGKVPGAPHWHLAPESMAWEGKTLAEICVQLKDPERNGGRKLEEIVRHMAEDELVGWGWKPGVGREPAPGTQKALGELLRAWMESGAVCPAG